MFFLNIILYNCKVKQSQSQKQPVSLCGNKGSGSTSKVPASVANLSSREGRGGSSSSSSKLPAFTEDDVDGQDENEFSMSEQEASGSHVLDDGFDYMTNALPPSTSIYGTKKDKRGNNAW